MEKINQGDQFFHKDKWLDTYRLRDGETPFSLHRHYRRRVCPHGKDATPDGKGVLCDDCHPFEVETREPWESAASIVVALNRDQNFRLSVFAAIKRACLAHAEGVTNERDLVIHAIRSAQKHLAQYQGGGTLEDVVSACEELAKAYDQFPEGEYEGADDINQAVQWLFHDRNEARQERDTAREKVKELTMERDGLAKANSDASRDMSDTLLRLTQAKELVKDYEFIRSEAVRMEKERDSELERVRELEQSLEVSTHTVNALHHTADAFIVRCQKLQSELTALRANSVPREVVEKAHILLRGIGSIDWTYQNVYDAACILRYALKPFNDIGASATDEPTSASREPLTSSGGASGVTFSNRITQYLSAGGLFNPEMMEHDKVRDLLMEIRDHLDSTTNQETDVKECQTINMIKIASVPPAKTHEDNTETCRTSVSNAAGRSDPDPAAERDWTEDSQHENGNYTNTCSICNKGFIGHKRRVVCKLCSQKDPAACEPGWKWLGGGNQFPSIGDVEVSDGLPQGMMLNIDSKFNVETLQGIRFAPSNLRYRRRITPTETSRLPSDEEIGRENLARHGGISDGLISAERMETFAIGAQWMRDEHAQRALVQADAEIQRLKEEVSRLNGLFSK